MSGDRRLVLLVANSLSAVLRVVPPTLVKKLVSYTAILRSRSLPPEEGLKLLFGIEAAIYPPEGTLAVAYGGGIHTKHRHMKYHDFFVNRVEPGEYVLDVGCGIGAVAFDLADRAGAKVVGIDLDAENIIIARSRFAHPSVEYVVGDAMKELPSEKYDVVILSNVLEHLPSRSKFLRKLCVRAQPNRMLIRVPSFERDWRVPLKQELGIEWRLDPTREIEYTQEIFSDEIAEAGLNISYLEIRWGEIWAEVRKGNGSG
jgi:SAM-dependent methyltransferase